MIVASSSDDIVYSNLFTGVHGNYLRGSICNACGATLGFALDLGATRL